MEKFKIGLELHVMMFVCFAFEVDSHLDASSVFLKGVYNLATILVPQFTQNSTLTAVAAKRRQPGPSRNRHKYIRESLCQAISWLVVEEFLT